MSARMKTAMVLAVFLVSLISFRAAASAQLHLIFNPNDGGDLYPADAGRTFAEAQDGVKPDVIDSAAEAYFVKLGEGATIEALGLPVKGHAQREQPGAAVESSGEAVADGAGSGTEDDGDTGWIELVASVASVYYWSETGEGESDWRLEDPRLFIRRFDNGDVLVFVGHGPPPDQSGSDGE